MQFRKFAESKYSFHLKTKHTTIIAVFVLFVWLDMRAPARVRQTVYRAELWFSLKSGCFIKPTRYCWFWCDAAQIPMRLGFNRWMCLRTTWEEIDENRKQTNHKLTTNLKIHLLRAVPHAIKLHCGSRMQMWSVVLLANLVLMWFSCAVCICLWFWAIYTFAFWAEILVKQWEKNNIWIDANSTKWMKCKQI